MHAASVSAPTAAIALELDDEQRCAVAADVATACFANRLERAGVKELQRGRNDARLTDLRDSGSRSFHARERCGERRTCLRGGDEAQEHLGDDAKRSFRADQEREHPGCRCVAAFADADDSPVREDRREAGNEICRDAVSERVRACRVAGDVATDRAGGRRARVRRVVQARGGCLGMDAGRDRTGLRVDSHRLGFEAEDAVEAGEAQDDAAV